ncbi:MAG TPA: DUF6580 family putative transport protein [Candidatus Saccharimonadales bacterium]|nr:DUF6580 family putative transport protein [Candidatus Saccharimonadales bacterium]
MGETPKPTAFLLTILAIFGRLLPHPPNFTPLTGATLFGGSKLSRPLNYLLPLGVLFLTDFFLGWHKTMPYVYGSFLLIAVMGEWGLKKSSSLGRVALFSLASSVLFFVITNFGVWQVGGLYPHTLIGLSQSYIIALPFFRNTILGDLVFSMGFFVLYQWAENRVVVARFDKKILNWLVS